jgi:hypothetical protein
MRPPIVRTGSSRQGVRVAGAKITRQTTVRMQSSQRGVHAVAAKIMQPLIVRTKNSGQHNSISKRHPTGRRRHFDMGPHVGRPNRLPCRSTGYEVKSETPATAYFRTPPLDERDEA